MSAQPDPGRRLKAGLWFSLVFHSAAIALLVWLAAREGFLGPPLNQITVNVVREPAPVLPPAPDQPRIPPPEPAPPSPSKPAPLVSAIASPDKITTLPAQPLPVIAAPAPVDLPSFAFEDGVKTVQITDDRAGGYRSFVEFSLRSRWNRPTGLADEHYVAEIEVAVNSAGVITDPLWKRKSGDARWDASVLDAIVQTRDLDQPPPPGFPSRLTIRFDVVPSEESLVK